MAIDGINCGIYVLFDIKTVFKLFRLLKLKQNEDTNILDMIDSCVDMFTAEDVRNERIFFAERLNGYHEQWNAMRYIFSALSRI